jgi:hypothetical protein
MRERSRMFMNVARGLVAALALVTAGAASADHYPDLPKSLKRKDRAVLEGLSRLTYGESTYITLAANTCDCLELTCDDGHFMIGCGGEIDLGMLTASRRTSRETCHVCGCAFVDGASLTATPVCAGF